MENCHCYLEITSKVFKDGINRYDHSYSIILSFTQKVFSLIMIIFFLIYIIKCIRQKRYITIMENSIFSYLDFSIPVLMNPPKGGGLSMRKKPKKNNKRKILGLLTRNEVFDSGAYKNTEVSHFQPISNEDISDNSPFFFMKNPKKHGKTNKVDESSLNIPFESIDTSMIQISDNGLLQKPKNLYNNPTTINKSNNEIYNRGIDYYEPLYLCDCYDCFFECCPSYIKQHLITPLIQYFSSQKLKLSNFLMQNSKILCYITIYLAPFVENPLVNISSILISDCLHYKTDQYFILLYILYSLIGVILSSLYFFSWVFITSFISTKKEFIEIHKSNKISRGILVYYHVKKAFIFTSFHFLIELALKAIFFFKNNYNSTKVGNDMIIFSLLENTFYLCFIIAKYPNFRNYNLIKDDDYLLKSQYKYFLLQNFLIKYLPKADIVYNSIKNEQDLEQVLDEVLVESKENLKSELKIIEAQKFRAILRNRGVSPLISIGLMWYMMIDSFLSVFIVSVYLIRLNINNYIPDAILEICHILLSLLNILQFLLFPWLIINALELKALFEYEES